MYEGFKRERKFNDKNYIVMALEIKGFILKKEDVTTFKADNGNEYSRQKVTLNCPLYDTYTGRLVKENYPTFEFSQEALIQQLANLNVGDFVQVKFALNGVKYTDSKTKETKYFTSVKGYHIEKIELKNEVKEPQQAQAQAVEQDAKQTAQAQNDLPF